MRPLTVPVTTHSTTKMLNLRFDMFSVVLDTLTQSRNMMIVYKISNLCLTLAVFMYIVKLELNFSVAIDLIWS